MLKSKLYNFLVEPKYRVWRHTLFILSFALISYRQTSYILRDSIGVVRDIIPFISLITLSVYLISLYTNIYFFVPRYLLKKKYKQYLLCFFFIIFIQILYLLTMEYIVRTSYGLPHRIASYDIFAFLHCIPSSTINMMVILGTSATVLFKHQVLENERMNRMERENLKSELDRLKEQISPTFLSNILNKTAILVKSDSQKAYIMLMKLGQLLRYQLYDSSRDKVLLSAEINFLKEYLELGQLYSDRIDYKVIVENEIKQLFVSPLLFIPFIQQSVNKTDEIDETIFLHIYFRMENSNLIFICRSNCEEILSDDEFFAIKKRLSLIYPDNYSLNVEKGTATLHLNNISEI